MQNSTVTLFSLMFVLHHKKIAPHHKMFCWTSAFFFFYVASDLRRCFTRGPALSIQSDFASFKENKSVPSRWLYFFSAQNRKTKCAAVTGWLAWGALPRKFEAWASENYLVGCYVLCSDVFPLFVPLKYKRAVRIRSMKTGYLFCFPVCGLNESSGLM